MSIEKTIETVRSHEGEISISEICDLADAYEALAAENAELREAVGHYANKSHWDESGVFGTKHDRYLGSQHYHGTDHGYEHAQAVLDKYE